MRVGPILVNSKDVFSTVSWFHRGLVGEKWMKCNSVLEFCMRMKIQIKMYLRSDHNKIGFAVMISDMKHVLVI